MKSKKPKKSRVPTQPDPMRPLRSEAVLYMSDERATAINLYASRLCCARTTAEDNIRAHLTDLGFKELPAVYLPREN